MYAQVYIGTTMQAGVTFRPTLSECSNSRAKRVPDDENYEPVGHPRGLVSSHDTSRLILSGIYSMFLCNELHCTAALETMAPWQTREGSENGGPLGMDFHACLGWWSTKESTRRYSNHDTGGGGGGREGGPGGTIILLSVRLAF
jgi:hypothetical protein